MKLRKFYTAKETIKNWKDNPQLDKIFANNVTDKGSVFKIYEHLMWLSTKKSKQSNLKNEQET